jgi:transposase
MFDGATFWVYLREWELASREAGWRVIVMIDNAQYHPARLHAHWRDEQQGRFDLDFRPPCSPELKPIERVWKRTRRNGLHNVYFPKRALVTPAVEEQFDEGSNPNTEPAALCRL